MFVCCKMPRVTKITKKNLFFVSFLNSKNAFLSKSFNTKSLWNFNLYKDFIEPNWYLTFCPYNGPSVQPAVQKSCSEEKLLQGTSRLASAITQGLFRAMDTINRQAGSYYTIKLPQYIIHQMSLELFDDLGIGSNYVWIKKGVAFI